MSMDDLYLDEIVSAMDVTGPTGATGATATAQNGFFTVNASSITNNTAIPYATSLYQWLKLCEGICNSIYAHSRTYL